MLRDGDSLLVTQRTEVTRLRDTNGDGVADEYLTAARGWKLFLSNRYMPDLPFALPERSSEIRSLKGLPIFIPSMRRWK